MARSSVADPVSRAPCWATLPFRAGSPEGTADVLEVGEGFGGFKGRGATAAGRPPAV